jgi:hypothetical protein
MIKKNTFALLKFTCITANNISLMNKTFCCTKDYKSTHRLMSMIYDSLQFQTERLKVVLLSSALRLHASSFLVKSAQHHLSAPCF